jgi:hypothetical protein
MAGRPRPDTHRKNRVYVKTSTEKPSSTPKRRSEGFFRSLLSGQVVTEVSHLPGARWRQQRNHLTTLVGGGDPGLDMARDGLSVWHDDLREELVLERGDPAIY